MKMARCALLGNYAAWGVDDALRDAGAESGDLVAIDDFTFEFVE